MTSCLLDRRSNLLAMAAKQTTELAKIIQIHTYAKQKLSLIDCVIGHSFTLSNQLEVIIFSDIFNETKGTTLHSKQYACKESHPNVCYGMYFIDFIGSLALYTIKIILLA